MYRGKPEALQTWILLQHDELEVEKQEISPFCAAINLQYFYLAAINTSIMPAICLLFSSEISLLSNPAISIELFDEPRYVLLVNSFIYFL
jgi:hypothetical protein